MKYGNKMPTIKTLKLNLDNQDNLVVQNAIMRDDCVTKIGGTHRGNDTALVSKITWTDRYYGRSADGTFIKKAFVHADGKIYLYDEVARTLTSVHTGLTRNTRPESVIMQVAGNSRMYFFNGSNTPIYYEGNDAGTWTESAIESKFVQGVIKDDRLWAFTDKSSSLHFSATLNPEDFSGTDAGEIIIGNDKDSFIRRIELLGDTIYIFKNDSIWALRGDTKATYQVDEIVAHTGLLAQRGLCKVGSALVFVAQQDKELYEFNGTWNIKLVSGETTNLILSDRLDLTQTDNIVCIWDRINNLFRLSYKGIETDETYNNYEAIAPTDELGRDGKWKWSSTYGARISCYSMWDRQGDHTLITGRSDTGKLMYHNRGSDWDEIGMDFIVRTDDLVPKGTDGFNKQFGSVFLKGVPSVGTIAMRTYLNSRLTGEGTRTSQTIADTGEATSGTFIPLRAQADFNNWIPLISPNYGESISLEFFDNTVGKEISLELVMITFMVRSRAKTKLVG